jgi:hypothetical protein
MNVQCPSRNSCGTAKSAGEQHHRGGIEEGGGRSDGGLEVAREATVAAQPGEGDVNGLIANDKFSDVRRQHLSA